MPLAAHPSAFPRLLALATFLLATAVNAQTAASFTPTWLQQTPSASPSARDASTSVYDAATGQVLLFGGFNSSISFSDTWTWNGATWAQQSPSASPSARHSSTMAYNAATGQVVLFGGINGSTYLADTWTWNGSTWAQQSPSTSPPAREGSTMAYDAATGQVVLFGGQNASGTSIADTWTWNGTTWTQQSPSASPPARSGATMAYDAATGLIVLFGGFGSTDYLADTWTWNGTTWVQQSPTSSPSGRSGSSMAYNSDTGQVVLFGGYRLGELADTWTWNGTTWTPQSTATSPSGRDGSTMAFDAATHQLVLFGGYHGGVQADTWTLQLGSINMGTANVCSSGTPTPCSQAATLTFTFSGTSGTIKAPVVLTQGATGLDFTDAGTGTCTTNGTSFSYASGTTCTVIATFAPKYPGQRLGAVELLSSSGTVIATTLISGTGTGPLAVALPGVLSTVAGSGTQCSSSTAACGDGGSATASGADLNEPFGLAVDGIGNLYIADTVNHRIRKITATTGYISTVAGSGNACPTPTATCGDGGSATASGADLNQPFGVAVDGAGNLYIADANDNRIRKVTVAGILSTVAGTGTACGSTTAKCGDGGPDTASGANLSYPNGVSVDGGGNIYIADSSNNRIRMVTAATGYLSTVAGSGTGCSSSTPGCGDGGFATASGADLSFPTGIALDGVGNLYIADQGENRIRKVTVATGYLSTVAGSGSRCSSSTAACGDGGSATASGADLGDPQGVAIDSAGNLYIADNFNSRVRKVTAATGYISTVAGTGAFCGYTACGDGGSATASGADFAYPQAVAIDGAGNLYIADDGLNRIRKVTATAATVPFTHTTTDGTTDTTDGTQTVTLANIGNATLAFAIPGTGITNPTTPTDFTFTTTGGAACPSLTSSASTQGTLASGATCTVPLTFTPVEPSNGALSESLTFTDNSLNASSATQSIPLTGTATDPAPTITTLSPTTGSTAGGTMVTLTGTNFTGATGVSFGGTASTLYTVNSVTSITATSPAHAAGPVSVTVTTPGGTSSGQTFTYVAPALTSLIVSGYKSPAVLTEASTLTVTAYDQQGSVYTAFTGTVTLTSSDSKATLPAPYTFTSTDAGTHTFNLTLNTLGTQSITATSGTVNASQTGILVGDAIWTLNAAGTLIKLNEAATSLLGGAVGSSATSSTLGGVAFDATGNAWSVTGANNTLDFVTKSGTGATTYSGGGLNAPVALAIDGAGSIWIANSTGNTVSEFSNAGAAQTSSNGYGSSYVAGDTLNSPSAIAIDNTGGVWVANKTANSVTHIFGGAQPAVTPLSTATANGTVGVKP
jgi:hypothetical protein